MQKAEVESEIIKHYSWMMRYVRRFYKQRCDCEDLVHDTIYKMLSSNSYQSRKDFKPWAIAIMSNTYYTAYARKQIVSFSSSVDTDSISGTLYSVEARDAMCYVEQCRKKSRIFSSLIYYAHGYSYEEISSMEGIPIGTVRSRISNCRKTLKSCI